MNCTRKFRCDGVMYMIKVLLADDQELIRESLGFVLGAQGDITVVGMAKTAARPSSWCGAKSRMSC